MTRYPLNWPGGWRRTPEAQRRLARFNKKILQPSSTLGGSGWLRASEVTIAEGTKRVLKQLSAFGVLEGDAMISTNLKVRLDGLPRSDQREPDDPGVAVYWQRPDDTTHKVMAIDRYDRIADNLAAIAATLEAMRAIERHGGAQILDRAFTGFEALPAPNDFRTVLQLTEKATREQAQARYRQLAKERHPDCGGTEAQMAELNWAWQTAQRELA